MVGRVVVVKEVLVVGSRVVVVVEDVIVVVVVMGVTTEVSLAAPHGLVTGLLLASPLYAATHR